jgi:DNA-binding transcriptional LysR family regulator
LQVITRHVASLPMALYAAKTYLARHGTPQDLTALMSHEFLGFDRSDLMLRLMQGMGVTRRREDFPLRCDDQLVYWALVRAGCGIGGMQCLIGDADPAVTQIAPFITLPTLPVWLTAPEALRQTPRIRRVFDHLADAFAALHA